MKRIFAILLTLCLLAALSACGGNTPAETVTTVDPATLPGKISGNTYTNDFLHLQCTLSEGWFFYSSEQIATLNNTTKEVMGSEISKLMESSGQFIDMFMSANSGMQNVSLTFEKNDHKMDRLDDKTLYASMETAIRTQLAAANMEVQDYSVETVRFCGEERDCIRMTQVYMNVDMTQYILYFRNGTDYYATLTVTLVGGGDVTPILDCFSKIS